jgi:hypothetical protein
MAEDSNQPSPGIGGNAFIWLAIVAALTAYVSRQVSLENLRPPASESEHIRVTNEQDIDARLWQDPFDSILESVGDQYGWSKEGRAKMAASRLLGANAPDCRNPGNNDDGHYCSPLQSNDNEAADAI